MNKFKFEFVPPNRKGSKNPHAKLTEEQVRQILEPCNRNRYGIGRAMAKAFGVCEGLIYAIRRGERWAHMRQAPTAKKR